jgi:hypothetical protein
MGGWSRLIVSSLDVDIYDSSKTIRILEWARMVVNADAQPPEDVHEPICSGYYPCRRLSLDAKSGLEDLSESPS